MSVTAADLASVLPASSPATFNRYANIITAALNLAKHKGWIDTIPRITKKRVEVKRLRWLTEGMAGALRRASESLLKPMALPY